MFGKNFYEAPEVVVLDVMVEAGFNTSFNSPDGSGTNESEWPEL